LWLQPGNAFQQSSDNLNLESNIDSLPFRHRFFMNHTMFVKKCDQRGFDAFANETFWALVMTLRSIACSDFSSLGHVEIPITHPQLQCNQENWDYS
jgi:hypothetical protein